MTTIQIGNSFCEIKGQLPPATEELINQCLHYSNEVEYELNSAYYFLTKLKKWGKSKKEIDTQRNKIQKIKDSEHVFLLQGRKFPTGLLKIVRSCLTKSNCPFLEKDLRKRPKPHLLLPWKNRPFTPRYYQKEMIDLGVEHGRGVFESAVGTGKLLISGHLIKKLRVRTLFIVPSSGLRRQVLSEFKIWFGSSKVGQIDPVKVRQKKDIPAIAITTIQTLSSLKKTGDLAFLLRDVEAVHIDEIHHSGADSYTNLQDDLDHIFFKFGYTGTFLRNDSKILSLWGVLSTVLYKYPAKKAIADGFLTPMAIHIHKIKGVNKSKYPREYEANYAGGIEMLQSVRKILRDTNLAKEQVLILVKLKSTGGALILNYLENQTTPNLVKKELTFISGDDSAEEINAHIHRFNRGRIIVLIGSSVIGEGIDIQATDHFINCAGGKSEIQIVQGAGRLVRLHPGKKLAHYHDFHFEGTKFMQKHLKERVKILIENFDPKSIEET